MSGVRRSMVRPHHACGTGAALALELVDFKTATMVNLPLSS